jgi:hypothetical protein
MRSFALDVGSGQETSSFYCNIGEKMIISHSTYIRHLKHRHKALPQNTTSSTSDENDPIWCRVCNYNYSRSDSFKNHLRKIRMYIKKAVRKRKGNPHLQPYENDPNYNCGSCEKKYSCKYYTTITYGRFTKCKFFHFCDLIKLLIF